jgi:DNA-binding HxlR family transcriptional regulator
MSPRIGSRPRPGTWRTAVGRPAAKPCTLTCPTRQTLDRLADRWTVVLLGQLETGTKRFGELRDSTAGISEKMLTQTLRGLERDGLIARRAHPGAAPQVDYRLTTLGRSILDPIATVRSWAQRHIAEIERARVGYDEATAVATTAASTTAVSTPHPAAQQVSTHKLDLR